MNTSPAVESNTGLRHCLGEGGYASPPAGSLTGYDFLRILLVSDDMRSAARLKRTLHTLGYSQTLVAYSGKRALDAIGAYSPVVAIVDLDLSDMTGYGLARSLRTHAELKVRRIPLIAVADRVETAAGELARAAGFLGVITKPVSAWLLNRLLLLGLL